MIQCGHYKYTSEFGESTELQFRRMPRARNFTGQFGVFAKDPDAGHVLCGVLTKDGEGFECVTSTYAHYFSMWQDILMTRPGKWKYELIKPQCAWCGREASVVGEFIHEKCVDKAK